MRIPRHHNLILRASVIQAVRQYFIDNGFLEVDTPHRIPANAPEEHIEPYASAAWYLHTSPEMCMKRLLCRGTGKIFQICRCWRRDERGARHLSEFTMLEWYRPDACYLELMRDCEGLLAHLVARFGRDGGVRFQGRLIALDSGSQRITVADAFRDFGMTDMHLAVRDGSFDEVVVERIEPALAHSDRPVVLMDYPADMAALARLKTSDPSVAERFELYVGGLELANGFSELNDATEQRRRFRQANERRIQAGVPPLPLPEPFLEELPAMPLSAGIALGIDRLVMILADAGRIDDVVAFTPEEL